MLEVFEEKKTYECLHFICCLEEASLVLVNQKYFIAKPKIFLLFSAILHMGGKSSTQIGEFFHRCLRIALHLKIVFVSVSDREFFSPNFSKFAVECD